MAHKIEKVAVLGAGVMGMGIAAHLANAGVPSVLLDIVPPKLTDEEKKSKKNRDAFAQGAKDGAVKVKGQIRPFMAASFGDLVTVGNFDDDLGLIADCDWIVEVVVERLDIKRNLFDKVAKLRKKGSILSSNTSGIRLADMIEGYDEDFQKNFLITHFFNPPRYLRLLELVAGEKTDPAAVKAIADFGSKALGKGIVYGKDTPNFVGNRIGVAGIMHTVACMQEMDMTMEEVDQITGSPMGHPRSATFGTGDLVGLDTLGHILDNSYASLPNDENRELFKKPAWLATMIEKGFLGNKTKGGFYKKVPDETGKKVKYQFDYKTLDYVPCTKPKFDILKKCKNIDDPGARMKVLVGDDSKAGQFAWKLFSGACVYSSNRLGEITGDVVNIDNAMKWGYAWEMGPFEQWDAVGVKDSVARMEAEGLVMPAVVKTMLAKSEGSWYMVRDGKRYFWDIASETYKPEPIEKEELTLKYVKTPSVIVKKNGSADLIDLGDGVLGLEFHSKMNAIDDDIIGMMNQAIDLLESRSDLNGMVIGNQSDNFSVGANLGLIMMLAMAQQFDPIRDAVTGLQKANRRAKYCSKPVVSAPFGMTLGGGAEVAMGADAICASAELYIGLVEVGAGLIPGGAGTLEMLDRHLEGIPADWTIDRFPFIQKAFENIGMAKVSLSAFEGVTNKFLRKTDKIVMNKAHLIYEAKQMVLGMAAAGYKPRRKADYLILPGKPGYATFDMGLYNMAMGGLITEYEGKIARKLANVLTGGDIEPNTAVAEEYILELEAEAFMSLVGEPKTIERMGSLLKNGKPLRN